MINYILWVTKILQYSAVDYLQFIMVEVMIPRSSTKRNAFLNSLMVYPSISYTVMILKKNIQSHSGMTLVVLFFSLQRETERQANCDWRGGSLLLYSQILHIHNICMYVCMRQPYYPTLIILGSLFQKNIEFDNLDVSPGRIDSTILGRING